MGWKKYCFRGGLLWLSPTALPRYRGQAFSKKEESWLIDTTLSQSRPGRRGGLQSTAKRSSSGDQNRQPCELGTGRDDCQELEFGGEAVQNLGQQLGILSHLWDFCMVPLRLSVLNYGFFNAERLLLVAALATKVKSRSEFRDSGGSFERGYSYR